jgi:hypothetical protein
LLEARVNAHKTLNRRFSPAALGLVLVACAGAQSPDDDEISIPLTSSTIEAKAPPPEPVKGDDELDQDTKDQIKGALKRAGELAATCNRSAQTNIVGEGTIDVTIDGGTGRFTDATMGAPFAGTPVEDCIKQAFVQEYALKFNGKLSLPYQLKLEPGTAVDPKKDPKKKPGPPPKK